jgi:tripartite-type tricarboxylate transporter receptor subunit TctC
VLAALPGLACAADVVWPAKPIRLIVPFAAGGTSDVLGRVIAERLSQALKQPVVIDNRGGAGGVIGADAAAKSPPDGYTILFNSSAATVNPVMYGKLRFDPAKELRPVAMLCEYYNLVVVNAEKVPAKTLAEFIELLRKSPGKYNFASNGARLGIELWKVDTGTDVTIVPYRGAADAITGLLRGDADFMIVNAPGLLPHIASGKLRALAFTGPQRDPDLPNVPTTAEAGLPSFTYSSFFGAYVPAGTPPDVVRRLSAGLNAVTAQPEVMAQFRQNGATAVQRSSEESAKRYDADIARYREIVERAKIPRAD